MIRLLTTKWVSDIEQSPKSNDYYIFKTKDHSAMIIYKE